MAADSTAGVRFGAAALPANRETLRTWATHLAKSSRKSPDVLGTQVDRVLHALNSRRDGRVCLGSVEIADESNDGACGHLAS